MSLLHVTSSITHLTAIDSITHLEGEGGGMLSKTYPPFTTQTSRPKSDNALLWTTPKTCAALNPKPLPLSLLLHRGGHWVGVAPLRDHESVTTTVHGKSETLEFQVTAHFATPVHN